VCVITSSCASVKEDQVEHEDAPQAGHHLLKLTGKTLNIPRTFFSVLLGVGE